MDSKERLIKNILLKLGEVIPDCLDKVQDVLTMEFNDFEVTESCREVAVRYTENEKLLRTFLATKKVEGLSDQSLKRYADINMKVLNYIGKPIKKITTNDLRYYLAVKQQEGNSTVSLDGLRRCMSTFYNWLVIEGYLDRSPCLNLKQIKCQKKTKQPLSDSELNTVRKSCKSYRDKALVEFLYSTGMRVSEVSQCNIEDVDLDNKECIVKHGKGGKQRIAYLSDECVNKLKRYLDTKNYSSTQSDSLFGLSKNGIENVISKLGKVNGVHLYPHKMRRTAATQLIKKGMGIESVSKILGHSSISTTQIYVSLDQSYIKNRYMECMNTI